MHLDTRIEPPCPRAFSPDSSWSSSCSRRRPPSPPSPKPPAPGARPPGMPRSKSKAPSNPATNRATGGPKPRSTTSPGAATRALSGRSPPTPAPTPSKSPSPDEEGNPAKFLRASTRYYVRLAVFNGTKITYSSPPNPFATTLPVTAPTVLSHQQRHRSHLHDRESLRQRRTRRQSRPCLQRQLQLRIHHPEQVLPDRLQRSLEGPAAPPHPVSAAGANPVSAEPDRPEPGATYHLRLTAANPGGSNSLAAQHTDHDRDRGAQRDDLGADPGGRHRGPLLRHDQSRSSARAAPLSMTSTGTSNVRRNASTPKAKS